MSMEKRGDVHNFGRFVKPIGKNWILKPRSTFWEQLFLSVDSKFRDELEQVLVDEPVMSGMPRLIFKKWIKDSSYTMVERIYCKPLLKSDPEYLLEALGGLLAIAAWFGISDLHNQNIFIGTDSRTGKFLLFPLDIEVVLSDLRLPSLTGILPTDRSERKMAGVSSIAAIIRSAKPRESLAVACAYMRTSQKLLSKSAQMIESLNATPGIDTAPIRIVLRDTQDYMIHMGQWPRKHLRDKKNPLDEDELEQMKRGDVPYFFNTIKDQQIQYFSNPDLSRSAYLKNQKRSLSRAPSLTLEKLFSIPDRNKALFEYGSMMLAAYFLPRHFQGEIRYRNMLLRASTRAIHIQFNDGILYKGARNWLAYLVSL